MLNSTSVGLSIQTIGGSKSGSAALVFLGANTQFLLHVKSKEISQFINGISNDRKNLLKYFTGTAILMFSNSVLLPSNFPTKSVL